MENKREIQKFVGRVIRTLRESQGINQRELCRKIKKKPGVVSAWETGKSMPDTGNLMLVAEVLGTTTSDILEKARILMTEGTLKVSVQAPVAATELRAFTEQPRPGERDLLTICRELLDCLLDDRRLGGMFQEDAAMFQKLTRFAWKQVQRSLFEIEAYRGRLIASAIGQQFDMGTFRERWRRGVTSAEPAGGEDQGVDRRGDRRGVSGGVSSGLPESIPASIGDRKRLTHPGRLPYERGMLCGAFLRSSWSWFR